MRALQPLDPYLRGAPPGLPFRFDDDTVRQGLNFTLTTRAGDLDLLGEATGGGTYEALLPHSEMRELSGLDCRFVNLETLIRLKRAAGRLKDLERIAELEALRQETGQASPWRGLARGAIRVSLCGAAGHWPGVFSCFEMRASSTGAACCAAVSTAGGSSSNVLTASTRARFSRARS